MLLGELLRGIDIIEINCGLDTEITGIKNDSRKVKPGDMFVAISGAAEDGSKYISSALENGAVAVCGEIRNSEFGIRNSILVKDSKEALSKLAAAFFGNPDLTMLGVTGTNGKTTVTHIIRAILGENGGLIGTNLNMVGTVAVPAERTTPDAVALYGLLRDMVDGGCRYCAMEVSSHALCQNRTGGIRYNVAAFTNLTPEHLDYHADMEDYYKAKRRLFEQCDIAVINIDDKYGRRLREECACPIIAYSLEDEKAELFARDIILRPGGVEFEACFSPDDTGRSETVRVSWHTPGRFSVYNALAAIGSVLAAARICSEFEGLRLADIAAKVGVAAPVMGRMESVPVSGPYTVIIDYAHTPDALENLLTAARETCTGRLITLFGCGGDRDGKRPWSSPLIYTKNI